MNVDFILKDCMSSFVIYLVFFTINILIFLRQFSFQICNSFKLTRKQTKAKACSPWTSCFLIGLSSNFLVILSVNDSLIFVAKKFIT